MPNKRIAILGTRGIPAQYGGFETFAEELSVRLVERGINVDVFFDMTGTSITEYKGVQLKHVRSYKLGPLTTIIHDLLSLIKALKGYDIIYLLGYGAGPFLLIPRLFQKTIWVNMDGLEWKRSKWPWHGRLYLKISERFAARFASLLIADAQEIKNYLISKYGKSINCHTIAYGAEVVNTPPAGHLIKNYELEPFGYYLVVCRLEPENHIREIIEGFEASDTLKKLIIVGDHRTNTTYLKKILKVKSKSKRVRFISTIFNKELLEAMRYYSFAYFHGHSVGGTNPSLLEALGCGNKVIAHDNPFNREVAADCAAYFTSSQDIPGIIKLLEAQNKMAVSTKAQERIKSIYNWDLIAKLYWQLISGAKKKE